MVNALQRVRCTESIVVASSLFLSLSLSFGIPRYECFREYTSFTEGREKGEREEIDFDLAWQLSILIGTTEMNSDDSSFDD